MTRQTHVTKRLDTARHITTRTRHFHNTRPRYVYVTEPHCDVSPRLLSVSSALKDETKRGHFRDKIKDYMARAEQVKEKVTQMKEGSDITKGGTDVA